jgi:acyl-CoA thioester hydrolase
VLQDQTEISVRFNEADPLGIVWHGHYVRYFEDGRESFGRHYGVSYLDFYAQGLAVPVVSIQCDYKKPLRYGDRVVVHTTFINSAAAKMKFSYEIYGSKDHLLIATGSSLQVFLDAETFALQLTTPPFFETWKKKNNLG